MPTSPIVYIVKQLGLKMADWSAIDAETKETLKTWAAEEMAILGVV